MDPASPTNDADELKKLEEELKSIEATPPAAPPPPPPPRVSVPGMPVPSQPVQPTPPPPKSKSPKILIAALGFLFLSFVGVGAYFLGAKKAVPQPTPTPSSSPTTASEPTADWKVYSGEGFSFKYPANIQATESSAVSGPSTGNPKILISLADPSTITEGTDAPFDGFSIYRASLTGLSFDSYIKKEIETKEIFNSEVWGPRGKTLQSTFQNWVTLTGPNFPSITVYYRPLPDGENVVVFGRAKKTNDFPATFEQILSTFKFVEASPSGYVCPEKGYVDCMPGPDKKVKAECTPKYLSWAQENCPNFKGVAY